MLNPFLRVEPCKEGFFWVSCFSHNHILSTSLSQYLATRRGSSSPTVVALLGDGNQRGLPPPQCHRCYETRPENQGIIATHFFLGGNGGIVVGWRALFLPASWFSGKLMLQLFWKVTTLLGTDLFSTEPWWWEGTKTLSTIMKRLKRCFVMASFWRLFRCLLVSERAIGPWLIWLEFRMLISNLHKPNLCQSKQH